MGSFNFRINDVEYPTFVTTSSDYFDLIRDDYRDDFIDTLGAEELDSDSFEFKCRFDDYLSFYWDHKWDPEWGMFADLKAELAEFNSELLFHELSITPGYYDGFEFEVDAQRYADVEDFCWEEHLYDLDDDVCDDLDDDSDAYYHHRAVSGVLAMERFDEEVTKIHRWLYERARLYGMSELLAEGWVPRYASSPEESRVRWIARGDDPISPVPNDELLAA